MFFQIMAESPILKEPCNNNNKNKIMQSKKIKNKKLIICMHKTTKILFHVIKKHNVSII